MSGLVKKTAKYMSVLALAVMLTLVAGGIAANTAMAQQPTSTPVPGAAATPVPTGAPGASPSPAAQGLFGEVISKDATSITIRTMKGNIETDVKLSVGADTQIRRPEDRLPVPLADVAVGTRVAVLARGPDNAMVAAKVMLIPAEPLREHRAMTVVEIRGKNLIGLDDRGMKQEVEMELEPGKNLDDLMGRLVTVVGAPGQTPASFKAKVAVKFDDVANQMEDRVQKLEVRLKGEVNDDAKAQLQQTLEQVRLMLDDNMQKNLDRLSQAIAMAADDNVKSALRNIQIKIRTKDEDSRSRRGRSSSHQDELEVRHQGQIAGITKIDDRNAITLRLENGEKVAFKLDDNPAVRRGRDKGAMDDVVAGFPVTLKVDDRTGLVKEIQILDDIDVKGTVKSFDAATGQLSVTKADGTVQTFQMKPGTVLDVQGRGDPIGAVKPGALVEVKFNNITNEVQMLEVKMRDQVKGVIKDINVAQRTATIVGPDGAEIKIKLDDNSRVSVRGMRMGAGTLKAGQEIEIEFEPGSGRALSMRSGPNDRAREAEVRGREAEARGREAEARGRAAEGEGARGREAEGEAPSGADSGGSRGGGSSSGGGSSGGGGGGGGGGGK